jgi:hypothetical protein
LKSRAAPLFAFIVEGAIRRRAQLKLGVGPETRLQKPPARLVHFVGSSAEIEIVSQRTRHRLVDR